MKENNLSKSEILILNGLKDGKKRNVREISNTTNLPPRVVRYHLIYKDCGKKYRDSFRRKNLLERKLVDVVDELSVPMPSSRHKTPIIKLRIFKITRKGRNILKSVGS